MDALRSFPKVGVDAALCMVMEEIEEVLSARARGAKGGGLAEIGGLKDRDWNPEIENDRRRTVSLLKQPVKRYKHVTLPDL